MKTATEKAMTTSPVRIRLSSATPKLTTTAAAVRTSRPMVTNFPASGLIFSSFENRSNCGIGKNSKNVQEKNLNQL